MFAQKEMALLGQELMLCRAGDLDLIRVRTGVSVISLHVLQIVISTMNTCSLSLFVKPFIQGDASPRRQLQFMEQLLTLVPGSSKSAEHRINGEMLLNELYSDENLPHLTQMLEPSFDPWPVHIKYAYCL